MYDIIKGNAFYGKIIIIFWEMCESNVLFGFLKGSKIWSKSLSRFLNFLNFSYGKYLKNETKCKDMAKLFSHTNTI